MVRVFGDPNFSLPRNKWQKTLHCASRLKGSHKDQSRFAAFEKFLQFVTALRIYSASTRDGFNQQQPFALRIMRYDIGHLSRWGNYHAQAFEVGRFEMEELAFRVTDVNDRRARRETRTKLLDDLFNKRVLSARRDRHRLPDGNFTGMRARLRSRSIALRIFTRFAR